NLPMAETPFWRFIPRGQKPSGHRPESSALPTPITAWNPLHRASVPVLSFIACAGSEQAFPAATSSSTTHQPPRIRKSSLERDSLARLYWLSLAFSHTIPRTIIMIMASLGSSPVRTAVLLLAALIASFAAVAQQPPPAKNARILLLPRNMASGDR